MNVAFSPFDGACGVGANENPIGLTESLLSFSVLEAGVDPKLIIGGRADFSCTELIELASRGGAAVELIPITVGVPASPVEDTISVPNVNPPEGLAIDSAGAAPNVNPPTDIGVVVEVHRGPPKLKLPTRDFVAGELPNFNPPLEGAEAVGTPPNENPPVPMDAPEVAPPVEDEVTLLSWPSRGVSQATHSVTLCSFCTLQTLHFHRFF